MTSIIIPAHNEAHVIGRCLSGVLCDAEAGEFDVIVVANGCTDRTVEIASQFRGVRVVELSQASKVDALNAGDRAANSFPRLYVDADVVIDAPAVRAVANLLASGAAELAAPRLRTDCAGRPWIIRAWFDVWQRLPYVTDNLAGAGVFGLSRSGRERFGPFTMMADDAQAWVSVPAARRRAVEGHWFTIHAPFSLRSHIKVQTRMRLFASRDRVVLEGARRDLRSRHLRALLSLSRDPRRWSSLAAYVAVTLLVLVNARLRVRSGRTVAWDRDDTTRREPGDFAVVTAHGRRA